MSSNKTIRELMEKKYGKRCMMEAAEIRHIPVSERKKIKGYRKTQEQLTYHHIIERSKGGPATEANGAVLKEYNHSWLHRQPIEVQQQIDERLQEYKAEVLTTKLAKPVESKNKSDLSTRSECITTITEEPKEKKTKFKRATIKRETKQMIEEYEEYLATQHSAKETMLNQLLSMIKYKGTILKSDETLSPEDKIEQADVLLNITKIIQDYDTVVALLKSKEINKLFDRDER